MKTSNRLLLLFLLLLSNPHAWADGSNVGKIESPYVQQLEKELEYELIIDDDDRESLDNQQSHKLAFGQSLSDYWLIEFGIGGSNNPGSSFTADEYEIEAKWQLSEQGEYTNDWALMFELEKEREYNVWEIGTTLIVLHEWDRWIGTANATIAYESGEGIRNEFEAELKAQIKYRYKAGFEPAIEYFKNEDTNALGPSVVGQIRLGGRKKLYWGAGFARSFDSSRPDTTFRANIEFEF